MGYSTPPFKHLSHGEEVAIYGAIGTSKHDRQGTGVHSGIRLYHSAQLVVIDLGGPPRSRLILQGPAARAKPGGPSATRTFADHILAHSLAYAAVSLYSRAS